MPARFVVYINGKIQHTDVDVIDGKWHHIALTWSNQNGTWQIFKDGQKKNEIGFDVKSGTTIQGKKQVLLCHKMVVIVLNVVKAFVLVRHKLRLFIYYLTYIVERLSCSK